MDRVRLGRALGYGARHAARSLLAAAEAAAAPSPAASSEPAPASPVTRPASRGPVAAATVFQRASQGVAHGAVQVRGAQQGARRQVRDAGKQAGRSFFAPFAKFSSVVSLQVTGTFFALLALVTGQAAWRSRSAFHLGWAAAEERKLCLVAGVAMLFAYFAVSNFVRAHRRDRRG